MKKTVKKLVLAKETLRSLGTSVLRDAKGASTEYACNPLTGLTCRICAETESYQC